MTDDQGKVIDGGEICVKTLKNGGCELIFCLHGGHLDPIFSGLH